MSESYNIMSAPPRDGMFPEREPLHGAIMRIHRKLFEDMLDLPPDIHVVAMTLDPRRMELILHLVGDSLPPVEEGCEAKSAYLYVQGKRDDEGYWWRHLRMAIEE